MHISFDFDYTLADSSEGTVVCVDYALDALGMAPRPPAEVKKTIGLSLERTFETLTGNREAETAATFKNLFLSHAQQVMLSHIQFYSHTPIALQNLKRQGHYVSIVSTKLKERIEEALNRDGISDLVDDVVGGGCVVKNKPHLEGLLRAMKTSGISEEETVYIGDSVSDGECARRAGVAFIGVLSGTTAISDLERWNPSGLLKHVGDIESIGSLIR